MKVSLTKGYFVRSMSLLSPQNEWREQARINYLISCSPEEAQGTCSFAFLRDWDVQECSSVINIGWQQHLGPFCFEDKCNALELHRKALKLKGLSKACGITHAGSLLFLMQARDQLCTPAADGTGIKYFVHGVTKWHRREQIGIPNWMHGGVGVAFSRRAACAWEEAGAMTHLGSADSRGTEVDCWVG